MDFGSDAYTTDLKIYGSDTDGGTVPSATLLYRDATLSLVNATTFSFDFPNNTTAYRYYWVHIDNAGAGNAGVKDFRFYTTGDFGLNHFTESGLAANDQMSDSPTDDIENGISNFATLNSIEPISSLTLSNGNTQMVSTSVWKSNRLTQTLSDGVGWYIEWADDSADGCMAGVATSTAPLNNYIGAAAGGGFAWDGAATLYSNGVSSSLGSAPSANERCMLAYKDGDLWVGKGDSWFSGDPADGSSPSVTGITGEVFFAFTSYSGRKITIYVSPDQWSYTVPTGFKSVCTANLPAPIKDPTKHFQVDTFTGTAGELARTLTDRSDAAFAPDLIWGTNRTTTGAVHMVDSVRGATKEIESDDYSDEATAAEGVKSFDASGYTLGTDADYNAASANVNWCFKLGGAPTADNSAGAAATPTAGSVKVNGANHGSAATGSIPVIRGSANTTAAMSAIKFTGTGANGTIDHFLGVVPEFIAVKTLANGSGGNSWRCYHSGVASDAQTDALQLNGLIAAADDSIFWNDTAPTSSVFSVGSSVEINKSSSPSIAYCFASVDNYSKIGSFEGNGNADGTFVPCNFRPAFILVKSADSTSEWDVYDSKRDGYNADNDALSISTPLAETTANDIDILSNGFKCRIATDPNVAETYVYMAIADHPSGLGVSQARAR